MIAQRSVSSLWHCSYAALQLPASSKPTVLVCASVLSCSSCRAGVGALQCACMRPSRRPGALVCIKLPGAYVLWLEERMHIEDRGVTQRIKIVEEIAIACGQIH
jgi:hypothetical protein